MNRLFVMSGCAILFPLLVALGWLAIEQTETNFPLFLYIAFTQLLTIVICGLLWQFTEPLSDAEKKAISQQHIMSELLASREQFYTLYEKSPIPYLTLDNNHKITLYNIAAIRLFATTKTDLLEQDFRSLIIDKGDEASDLVRSKLTVRVPLTRRRGRRTSS